MLANRDRTLRQYGVKLTLEDESGEFKTGIPSINPKVSTAMECFQIKKLITNKEYSLTKFY